MMIYDQLQEIRRKAKEKLDSLSEDASAALEQLEQFRVDFFGKKGEMTNVMKMMKDVSPEDRPAVGNSMNEVRTYIEEEIKKKKEKLAAQVLEEKLKKEKIDVTLPGTSIRMGRKHPSSIVLDEVKDAFISMGFSIVDGPEVELDYYNFEALNIPKHHPARDTQDTFYFSPEVLLRTQTSSVQIRSMEKMKPPIKIISPGRVYRIDEIDATHSPIFNQIEGLVVDKGINMAHLKGALDVMAKKLFGENITTRIRPDYFPFTEPSAEISVSCFMCGGKGCQFCKNEGYIEIGGAGMVNPKVLEPLGIDPNEYSGFAFGMGLERLTMIRFGITDIRQLFENDIRFLESF